MPVLIEPVEWAVRKVEKSWGEPPSAVCLVQKSGPDTVFASLAHGEMNRKDFLELHYFLYDLGYREFHMVRHGKVVKLKMRKRKDNG